MAMDCSENNWVSKTYNSRQEVNKPTGTWRDNSNDDVNQKSPWTNSSACERRGEIEKQNKSLLPSAMYKTPNKFVKNTKISSVCSHKQHRKIEKQKQADNRTLETFLHKTRTKPLEYSTKLMKYKKGNFPRQNIKSNYSAENTATLIRSRKTGIIHESTFENLDICNLIDDVHPYSPRVNAFKKNKTFGYKAAKQQLVSSYSRDLSESSPLLLRQNVSSLTTTPRYYSDGELPDIDERSGRGVARIQHKRASKRMHSRRFIPFTSETDEDISIKTARKPMRQLGRRNSKFTYNLVTPRSGTDSDLNAATNLAIKKHKIINTLETIGVRNIVKTPVKKRNSTKASYKKKSDELQIYDMGNIGRRQSFNTRIIQKASRRCSSLESSDSSAGVLSESDDQESDSDTSSVAQVR